MAPEPGKVKSEKKKTAVALAGPSKGGECEKKGRRRRRTVSIISRRRANPPRQVASS